MRFAFGLAVLIFGGLLAAAETPPALARFDKAQLKPGVKATAGVDHSVLGPRRLTLRLGLDGAAVGIWSYRVGYTIRSDVGAVVPISGDLEISSGANRKLDEAITVYAMDGDTFTLTVDAIESPNPGAVPAEVSFAFAVTAFDASAKPTLVYGQAEPDHIHISSPVPGAVEYDLEWVFVDAKDPVLPQSPFARKDPVRISGPGLSFPIDRHYPRGQLHYRARAVVYHPLVSRGESTGRLAGAWSDTVTINLAGRASEGFFEPRKNWTYQITYLEGPRFKRLMSFYDGGLQNRQTQTLLDSEGIRLVADTKYDFENRPALKFLPTPVLGRTLSFLPRLNLARGPNNTMVEFTPDLFNQGTTNAASIQTGAGKYYSASNDVDGPMRDYIPDAEGFPYSTVEHTRDGTGRLRRSSGFGKELRLDGGHDTIFRYGSANATQLRRLFGSNVGPARQYARNVVSDPNRQSTVSYLDDSDRVIATALAGSAPPNLVSIAPPASSVAVDLGENNVVNRASGTSQSVSTIVNEVTSNYHFKYDLTAVDYKVASGDPDVPALCASGKYELTISITDPHGHPVPLNIGSTPQNDPDCLCATQECTQTVNKLEQTLGNPNPVNCSLAAIGSSGFSVPTQRFCAKLTEPGEYEVSKIVRLSEGELQHRIDETKLAAGITNAPAWINSWTAAHAPDPAYCAGGCEEFCKEATAGDPQKLKDCVRSCQSAQEWVIPRATQQECDGLRKSIQQDVQLGGWARDNYGAKKAEDHPEFCHLAICNDPTVMKSRTYDALTVSSETWKNASCLGYLNPLGMPAGPKGPPVKPAGCNPSNDPYFLAGAFGDGHGTGGEMEQYLLHYTDTLKDWPDAPLSLWEFVALPKVHPGMAAPVPPDDQWRLFRSIYQGLKQRVHLGIVENKRHCSYLDDPHANVKRPYAFSSVNEAFAAMDHAEAQYRPLVCDARVAQWRAQLEQTCHLPQRKTTGQVQQLLGQFCIESFGLSNPLGVLTKGALNSGNQLLKNIQDALGGCDLRNIAIDDPYDHQRICRTVCCKDKTPNSCAQELLDALKTLLPARAGQAVNLNRSDRTPFGKTCVGWADELVASEGALELRTRDRRRGCRLVLVEASGRIASPASVTNPVAIVTLATSQAPAAPAPELTFAGFALEATLRGTPARFFLFSDCGFPSVDQTERVCSRQVSGACLATLPERGEEAKSAAATLILRNGWAAVCTQSLIPGTSDLVWPPRPEITYTLAASPPYKPADPQQDSLSCRSCLRELLTAALQRSNNGPEVQNAIGHTPCFERIILRDEVLISAQVGPPRRECQTIFLTETAARISPSSVVSVLDLLAAAPLPAKLPATVSGLSFTGFALKVRLQSNREIIVYIFSSCELRPDTDCPLPPDCGIGLRADDCLRSALRLLEGRINQAPQLVSMRPSLKSVAWEKCFDQFEIDGQSARLHRRGHNADDYCSLTFLDANGRRISPDSVAEVAGMPHVASASPPNLPASLPDAGSFTGFAVQLKLAMTPPATVEAWIYSTCGFRTQADCDDVPTGTPIPPFPKAADPVKTCQKAVDEETKQRANIEWESQSRHIEAKARDVFFNKCLDAPFGERFTYNTSLPEYHYTLYYYDQAGNLVQTVPPAGVDVLTQAQIDKYETPGAATENPKHQAFTLYRYNSLNQVIQQSGPNDGVKRFWYNDAGQLRFSQDAAQAARGEYGYLKYDARSRVIESGVVRGLTEIEIQTNWDKREFPAQGAFKLAEVTQTVYDSAESAPVCKALQPVNLRGRVAAAMADAGQGRPPTTTCYSYDPHGNVQMLAQLLPGLELKRIDYEYDLLSGKVLATHYQSGKLDALHHRFTYDGDNRVLKVETSRDEQTWERDAAYTYYKHGPLARLELGKNRVQGLDYTYTVQGWPKGINAGSGKLSADPGHDGQPNSLNAAVGADAFGMTIDYFLGDYTPIGLARGAFALSSSPHPIAATGGDNGFSASAFARDACGTVTPEGCGLYDGNIARIVTALRAFMPDGESPLGFAYRYDQLYRLRSARSHTDLDLAKNAWPATSVTPGAWWTTIDYDSNDNIRKLQRFAKRTSGNDPPNSPSAWMMDDLTYRYEDDAQGRPLKDRLLHINDTVPASRYPDDIDDQGNFVAGNPPTYNYTYDQAGRLVGDRAEAISEIDWNRNSQVTAIHRSQGRDLEFIYDALGHRVAKVVKAGAAEDTWEYEYFVRDPAGTTLATYRKHWEHPPNLPPAPLVSLEDQTLIGAQRLGVWTVSNENFPNGQKQYELNTYNQTVAATVSDHPPEVIAGIPAAEVLTSADYDPFGSLLPGRRSESKAYRYGFTSLERDDEVKGAGNSYYTNARLYDPRVGRWLSVDPVSLAKPHAATGSYSFAANNPLKYTDRDGRFVTGSAKYRKNYVSGPEGDLIETPKDDLLGLEAAGNIIGTDFGKAYVGYERAFVGKATSWQEYVEPGLYVLHGVLVGAVEVGEALIFKRSIEPAAQTPKAEPPKAASGAQAALDAAVEGIPGGRGANKLRPDPKAEGPHTTFRRDPQTGQVTHYETWNPQSNPQNPNPWESAGRFDATGASHYNRETGQHVPTPHVHDPTTPGGVRPARPEEVPK